MRVIAGSHKGRRLLTPKHHGVRPTSGRVKEALFSILGDRLCHARFLDLYAGTGAIGIEALSRGADQVVFVESDPASLRLLRGNLEQCGLLDHAEIVAGSAESFLRQRRPGGGAYDIVFADPPYWLDSNSFLRSLGSSAIIRPGTVVALEHPSKYVLPPTIGLLSRVRQYRYGDTSLSTFQVRTEVVPS